MAWEGRLWVRIRVPLHLVNVALRRNVVDRPYGAWPHFPTSEPNPNAQPSPDNTNVDPREPPARVEDEVDDLADAPGGEFGGESDEEYVHEPWRLTRAQRRNFGMPLASS